MTKEELHSIRTLCLNCTKYKTCQFLCDALDTIIQALQTRDAKLKTNKECGLTIEKKETLKCVSKN